MLISNVISLTFVWNGILHVGKKTVQWPSGRASDSEAKGPGLEPHDHLVVSLSEIFKALQSIGKYPGSSGSIPA